MPLHIAAIHYCISSPKLSKISPCHETLPSFAFVEFCLKASPISLAFFFLHDFFYIPSATNLFTKATKFEAVPRIPNMQPVLYGDGIFPGQNASPPLFSLYQGSSCAIMILTLGISESSRIFLIVSAATSLFTCIHPFPVSPAISLCPVMRLQQCALSPPKYNQPPSADVRTRTFT